jgi:type III restriction enzyme
MSERGAEFRKSDLQIHSPRDANWEGLRPEDTLGARSAWTAEKIEDARRTYCESLINRCISEGLRAIAITDHHEGIYAYAAIRAKATMEQTEGPIDLWIFPGMELTCKDSCQALIIFDADFPQALFEKARNKLGLPADCDANNSKGIQVELLTSNIADIQPLLEADDELRDRFIILPHVKPGGHKTVLRVGFHKRFKDMPYVGGYMDQCYPDDLDERDRKILDGEIPAWSSEKRGVISTSDARQANFNLIGKHASWLKLASPTAESIRQAMLAPDSRIRHEEPKLPSVVITKVDIQGASYLENGEYEFNQQMNSIIGGRGAGKSSLMEYIRFALGCSALDGQDAEDNDSSSTNRMRDMLRSTLSAEEGAVVANVLLNSAPLKLSRSVATAKLIQVESEGHVYSSTADDVVRLIPVQPFRQGELSDLGRDELANRLLGLVTASASDAVKEIEEAFKKNGQKLSEAMAKAVRLTAARQLKGKLETESKLLRSQIDSLQKHLGLVAPLQNSTVADHDKYLDEERNVSEIREIIENTQIEFELAFEHLAENLTRLIEARPLLDLEELQKLYGLVKQRLTSETSQESSSLPNLELAVSDVFEKMLSDLSQEDAAWHERLKLHEADYALQKEAMIGQQDVLARLEDLNAKLKRAGSDLDTAITDEQEFRSADDDLQSLRVEHRTLQRQLVEIVAAQVATIYDKSSQLARGELATELDYSEVEEAIRSVVDVPMLREKRIDDLLDLVRNSANPSDTWESLIDEMIVLVKWKEGIATDDNKLPETPLLMSALETGFMEKLRYSISSDRVAGALRAVLNPRVNIYQQREGTEIDFRKASQGEQTATLLNILMNQSRGPLLIDQPEEDLDNKIINDIIKTIHRTKDDRQLILSTHNANIVVNGDSELVMELVLGEEQATGAIDEAEVHEAIIATMEGGKDAFELRRKKYNF